MIAGSISEIIQHRLPIWLHLPHPVSEKMLEQIVERSKMILHRRVVLEFGGFSDGSCGYSPKAVTAYERFSCLHQLELAFGR